eukprot:4998577-Karenia_brevis.AAC.1
MVGDKSCYLVRQLVSRIVLISADLDVPSGPLSFALRSVPTCCTLCGKHGVRSKGLDMSIVGSASPC